jgi:hypothetical protein
MTRQPSQCRTRAAGAVLTPEVYDMVLVTGLANEYLQNEG